MPVDNSDIAELMNLTNEKILGYFLERHGTPVNGRRRPSLPPVRTQEVISDLGTWAEEEFRNLFVFSDDAEHISVTAAPQIINYAVDGADAGDLKFSLGLLRRLKTKIINHQQDSALQRIHAYLSPVSDALRVMISECESDDVFPMDYSEDSRRMREVFTEGLDSMLEDFDPDILADYFEAANEVITFHNDVKAGVKMMNRIEEETFRWCLTPEKPVIDENLMDKYGSLQYNYAQVIISLEEMKIRLKNINRLKHGIIKGLPGYDYTESTSAESKLLDSVLEDIGSQGLLKDIMIGDSDITGTLAGIALQGPKHLDMTLTYIDMFISKIHAEVFGESKVISKYTPVKGYIIVEEPRQLVVCTRQQLINMGFEEDIQIGSFGDIARGGKAKGILTLYTILESPPPEYQGKPPAGVVSGDGKVYTAKRTKVIDFFSDDAEVPEALLEGLELKDPLADPDFIRALSEARIPESFYQVSIAYMAIMQKERVLRESIMRDGSGVPVRQVRLKQGNLGAHDEVKRFIDENPYSHRMSIDELAGRISR